MQLLFESSGEWLHRGLRSAVCLRYILSGTRSFCLSENLTLILYSHSIRSLAVFASSA